MATAAEFLERPSSPLERHTRHIFSSWFEFGTFVLLVALAGSVAIFKLIEVSSSYSLEWDSAAFLTNAANYAGFSQYGQALDPTRPPVIPFLLSLAFRVTGPLVIDGYILSAIFYLAAMVGCFLIAKEMMNPALALLAALSYGLAPFVFQWAGILLSDVEGVGVASLALAALILSVKKNKRLLLFAVPLFVLAALTRYSLGLLIPVAIVYLFAARKQDWILDHYEFYYGVGLGILAIAIFGGQWISYPFIHHMTISVLFPTPAAVNPFHSVLGPTFYAANLSSVLGVGIYGELLAVLFVGVLAYILYKFLRGNAKDVNPIAIALVAWFAFMFAYYSFGWPYDDLRYSAEFIMPVILLAFYSISLLLQPLEKRVNWHVTEKKLISGLSVAVIAMVILAAGYVFVQSGQNVMTNTQPVEVSLNAGMRQAVSWLESSGVPTSDKIESNWYTLLWWYAPNYQTTAAPLDYQLVGSASYRSWQTDIATGHVAYVVYVDPGSQMQQEMPMLVPVFNSSVGDVVVYSVK